jgi:hypothetical protein
MWTAPGSAASTPSRDASAATTQAARKPARSPLASQPGTSPESGQGGADCRSESAQVLTNRLWEASHPRGSGNQADYLAKPTGQMAYP